MFTIKGFYNSATVFADTKDVDQGAIDQIKELLSKEFVAGSKIRIMTDVHSGAGCVIGTTMTIEDTVVPNLVGVDIGCGLEVVALENKKIDFEALDAFIKRNIPAGFQINKQPHSYNEQIDLGRLKAKKHLDLKRARLSIGTLGGGNHFIEMNIDSKGTRYLVVHSGSRNIGLQVANYYQKLASGESRDPLAHLEGKAFDDYLHDMALMQRFATINRKAIVQDILDAMGFEERERFTTIHNYIDTDEMILRKGAVSAQSGERLIIPLNMRDGSLLCTGKGNPNWNYSAPHGAGRVMSRREAKRKLNMRAYRSMMKDVYTSSVSKATLDESPEAYKDYELLLSHIGETVSVDEHIKPIYNFKAP